MHLFASHFGCYEVDYHGAQPVLVPFRKDPEPSVVGQSYLELAQDQARLRRPLARKGWLAGDGGSARGDDEFVEISSDEAVDRAAEALRSVRARHGDSSVFAGSYGWASAGRFHNPQTHLKRFLKLTGGFTSSRHTYSFGAAEVLLPRLVGSAFADPADLTPQWNDIVSARPFLLSFGGMRRSNAQVGAGGVGQHMTSEWLDRLKVAGGEMLTISPDADDAPFGAHLKINAGTDVFVLLALAYELVERGQQDEAFLTRCCSGWPKIRRLLSGELDGRPKTPEWAAQATGISAAKLREIATRLGGRASLINLAWSLQRSYVGEQSYWAAVVLAAICGQIGKAGLGIACGLVATAAIGMPRRKLQMPAWDHTENPVKTFIPVALITDMLERPGEQFLYNGQRLTYPDARLVWWAGGNPFHHHQDLGRLARAWKTPETIIVNDPMRTATVAHADLVLPATLPFERSDIVAARRDDWLVLSKEVQRPPEGCLNDFEWFAKLAARFDVEAAFTGGLDEAQWLERIYGTYRDNFAELPDWAEFCATGYARLSGVQDPASATPLGDFVAAPDAAPLDTETGRIDLAPGFIFDRDTKLGQPLCHPVAADQGESTDFPLRLLSPQPEARLHSQLDTAKLAQQAKQNGFECARAHPMEIARAGLAPGDLAEIWNPRGITVVTLIGDPKVAPGHLVLPTGAWYRPIRDAVGRLVDLGGNPNTLTRDLGSSSLAQGASAGGARVAIRAVQTSLAEFV